MLVSTTAVIQTFGSVEIIFYHPSNHTAMES